MNVFVFPCGSEIGLEIFKSLSSKKNINLIGGSSTKDHGCFVYEYCIDDIPFIYTENCIFRIKEIVKNLNIDYIFPCTDETIWYLKENEKEINCKVLSSDLETVKICLDKEKTYNLFKNILLTPVVFEKNSNFKFPIFLKPKIGHSSKDCFKINDKIELDFYIYKFPESLILEYLSGEEFTVDCFTSYLGELKFVSGRKRTRISNGISVSTKIIYDDRFLNLANKINKTLKFNGSWFFQVKENNNKDLVLLEIASRFAGSSSIQRVKGINFSELTLLNAQKENSSISIIENNFEIDFDRSLDVKIKLNLNFTNVYIDLDDTIIVNEKIDPEIIKVIFHFINKNKKIILITKHENSNLTYILKKYRIDGIFDKIIHLNKDSEKSNFVKGDSIFIDDSFNERFKISKKGIPVFSNETVKNIILWGK